MQKIAPIFQYSAGINASISRSRSTINRAANVQAELIAAGLVPRQMTDATLPGRLFREDLFRQAITKLVALQHEMDIRYLQLEAVRRRKIVAQDSLPVIMAVFDELAYFTSVAVTKDQQEMFMTLLLDVIQRGRAVGIIVVARAAGATSDVPILPRDVIRSLNNRPTTTLQALRDAVRALKPGEPAVLQIQREGRLMYVSFMLD